MREREVLYLLHGLLCDNHVWEAQRRDLEDRFDVRIPCFRGFDSLTGMAEHVLNGAPGRFKVAGHSMGGRIALEIVRLSGQRLSGLALLDTGVHPVTDSEPEKRQEMIHLARSYGMRTLAHRWAPPMVHPARTDDQELMGIIFGMVESYSIEDYENQIAALLGREDASPLLENIFCDTLVLCGREDSWSPVQQHVEIAARIPRATLKIIENCGHMSTLERPEQVTQAMKDWLQY